MQQAQQQQQAILERLDRYITSQQAGDATDRNPSSKGKEKAVGNDNIGPLAKGAEEKKISRDQQKDQESTSNNVDKRWRIDDTGYFDPQVGGYKEVVHCVREVAWQKGYKLIAMNISTMFQNEAYTWYAHELIDQQKFQLKNATSIEPWCEAIKARFKRPDYKLVEKLLALSYTRNDVRQRRDLVVFHYQVLTIYDEIVTANAATNAISYYLNRMEGTLRNQLINFEHTDIAAFI